MDQVLAVIGLVLIFGLAFWRNLNMGAVAMAITFLIGAFYFDLTGQEIAAGFPGHLVITLIGVTYIFGIGRVNGTVDQVVHTLVTAVHGKVALIPWVFFILAAAITASGALSIATYSILVPIGMAFAHKNKINPLLMGLSIINGTNAGGFSPIAVYYTIISAAIRQLGFELDSILLFFWTFMGSFLLNIVVYVMFDGMKLVRRDRTESYSIQDSPESSGPDWTRERVLTVAVLLVIVAGALLYGLDVGFMAMAGAVFLAALRPDDAREGLQQIGWGVILLIGGMVTYINMLDSTGTIEGLAQNVSSIGSPAFSALLLLYIAAIVSAFASTNAMFVVLVPLAAPLLLTGDIGVMGFAIALSLAAVVVDTSPFSTAGALVVANIDRSRTDRVFRGLLWWACGMMVLAPPVVWAAFVLTG